MLAAGLGRVQLVQGLIQHGARRNDVTGKYQLAALSFAAWVKNIPTMLVLLGKSPNIEEQSARVEISIGSQRANYFKNGMLALSTQVSTGRPGYSTPKGQFVVTDKNRSRFSSLYKCEMPFFMRLNCSEFGMHAGVVPNHPASHGCIRLPRENAMKLFQQLEVGTLVTIAN
jgi:lipoprotein-anchoring transpeptidase ErfK/SrfK